MSDAVGRTLILFEASHPPAGELPVVLAAGASGILLHEAIGHGLEADFNRKGVSIYSDMLGQRVAAPFVTVVDQATLAHERGALNYDDEGQPGGRTVLVENGVLNAYLHDAISARHYKTHPTGSGRRQSYKHAPLPRMTCTFMENGPHSREEIIGRSSAASSPRRMAKRPGPDRGGRLHLFYQKRLVDRKRANHRANQRL